MLPLQAFKDFISRNKLFSNGQKILLAVSGGRDSVLMTHLFKLSGYNFGIAHCNFNLRADESQRDETFVRMLATTLEIPFHVTQFKTKDYAALHHISTQMAARDLRYQWFEEIRQSQNYDVIALGQHQNDAIETVMLNLTRGTGIAGLHGILPKRDKLVRPMLFLSRKEIDQLIIDNKISYVEDSSNLSVDYTRNKLRYQVIPVLKEINPNLEQNFQQSIQRFAEAELVLQNAVRKLERKIFIKRQNYISLSISKIRELLPQQLLLFEMLRTYGFSEGVVADILRSLDGQSGKSFYSSTHRIVIDRDDLILCLLENEDHVDTLVHPADHSIHLSRYNMIISYSDEPFFEKMQNKAFVNADKLIYPLVIRKRRRGDKFMPIGMKTFKKLSDFFIDEKIPLNEKDNIPVVVNGNGDIIWIAGLRQDERYKVTAVTKKLAIIELKPSNYNS